MNFRRCPAIIRVPLVFFVVVSHAIDSVAPSRTFVKAWVKGDFDDVISVGLESNRDHENGRLWFDAAECSSCHQLNAKGSKKGPDLGKLKHQFSPDDLLEAIIEPDKDGPDGYTRTLFELEDGTLVDGIVTGTSEDKIRVNTDLRNPEAITVIERNRLKTRKESPKSLMPTGLLDTLGKDDVLDLLAYLLAGGDPADPMFAQ